MIRADLVRGALDPAADGPRRTVVELVMSGGAASVRDVVARQGAPLELSPAAFEARRAQAPKSIGEIGPIQDRTDAYEVEVLLDSRPQRLRLAVFRVSKVPWNEWWGSHVREFDPSIVREVAKDLALPAPAQGNAAAQKFDGIASLPACRPDDTWTPFALSGRASHSAIWNGSVMIIWGGSNERGLLDSGGRYDPVTDSWTPTSLAGAPSARSDQIAAWTGSSMLIWGGADATQWLNDGKRYDPVADAWSPISLTNAPPARRYLGAWSGSRLLVWGSFEGTPNSGGVYDPATDVWTSISTIDSPEPRHSYSLVWAGHDLIVWGGVGASALLNTGGRYDPVSDSWRSTSLSGAPTPRNDSALVWTGSEMLVWGGHIFDPGIGDRFFGAALELLAESGVASGHRSGNADRDIGPSAEGRDGERKR